MTEPDGNTSLEYLFDDEGLSEFLKYATLDTKERMLQKVKNLLHVNYWLKIRGVPIWGSLKDAQLVKLRKQLRKAIYDEKLKENEFIIKKDEKNTLKKCHKTYKQKNGFKYKNPYFKSLERRVDELSKRESKQTKTDEQNQNSSQNSENSNEKKRVKFYLDDEKKSEIQNEEPQSNSNLKQKNNNQCQAEEDEEEEYVNHIGIHSIHEGIEKCKYHVTFLPSDEYDYYEEEEDRRIYMQEYV